MAGSDESRVRFLDTAVELLGRGGARGTLRVCGESMTPTLRPGNQVAVDFSDEEPRWGDVLLFRQVDYLTVHRLLGTARHPDGRPCLRTRGDGRHRLDPPLDRTRVHGRVFAVRGEDGWRDMRSGGARFYARALAFHDLAWAAAGVLAARLDRLVGRKEERGVFESASAFVDQKLLALTHRLLFARIHPRIDRPEGLERDSDEVPHSP